MNQTSKLIPPQFVHDSHFQTKKWSALIFPIEKQTQKSQKGKGVVHKWCAM